MGSAKNCSNYCTVALISHAFKVMLKIIQVRLQQYMNQEIPGVQAGFRKGKGTRHQIASICCIIEKAREFRQSSASLTMLKPLTVWIITNRGKFLEVRIQDHLTYLLRNLYAGQEATVRTGHGNNRVVPNQERSTPSLYTVTLLI